MSLAWAATCVPASLVGGSLLAVRYLRQFNSDYGGPMLHRTARLPIACTSDVAATIVFYLVTLLAARAWRGSRPLRARPTMLLSDTEATPMPSPLLGGSATEEKAKQCEKWKHSSKPSVTQQLAASVEVEGEATAGSSNVPALGAFFAIALVALSIVAMAFAVILFENDSSGMPFDFVHFYEMRANLAEASKWVTITPTQIERAVAPPVAGALLVGVSMAVLRFRVPPRIRFLFLTAYLGLGIFVQRLEPDEYRSENMLVEALLGYRTYRQAKTVVVTGERVDDALLYGHSNIHSPYRPEYSHANATAPRHIFHVLLESASSLSYPFDGFCADHGCEDISSPNAHLLTSEHMTPNYARFVNESYNLGTLMSTTSFSNKAHFASVCGTMPELKDWTSEHEKPTALPCLPELLKAMDPEFATAMFTGGDAEWDELDGMLRRAGVDLALGKDDIKERGLPCTEFTNMMCGDDEIFPFMEEWIDTQLAQDKRIFLEFATINLHIDYYHKGKTINYTESAMANAYLNSLRWSDEVLGLFLQMLEKRGLLENSLVYVHGDHADHLSRNPDDYLDIGLNEDVYDVPFALRMPGGSAVGKVTPSPLQMHHSLDILPTILDALHISPDLISLYSGRSMLRSLPSTSPRTSNLTVEEDDTRLLFTTESPGKTAIMLHEGQRKLVRMNTRNGHFCAFDRTKDPNPDRFCFYAHRVDSGDDVNEAPSWQRLNLPTWLSSEEVEALEKWIDGGALARFHQHLDVNARYWSDAAVEAHEVRHARVLDMAKGGLIGH